jgi:hypothetical protein
MDPRFWIISGPSVKVFVAVSTYCFRILHRLQLLFNSEKGEGMRINGNYDRMWQKLPYPSIGISWGRLSVKERKGSAYTRTISANVEI